MTGQAGWYGGAEAPPRWLSTLGLGPRGMCPAVDDDGQGCIRGAGHRSPHLNTGVRAWLESTARNALIRTYVGPRAGDHFVEEAALFAAFGFRPIAHEEARSTTRVGPGMLDIMLLGILAGLASSTQRRRRLTVCYHRCDSGPVEELVGVPVDEGKHPWPDEDPEEVDTSWPVDGPDEPAEPIDPPG